MTQRETIVNEITRLERVAESANTELEALRSKLANELPNLLDRDIQAEAMAAIARKNEFLKRVGLLP